MRNDTMRINSNFTFQDIYEFTDGNNTISIKGNPNLGSVKTIMIGITNPGTGNGAEQSGEIWVNELRLSNFNEKGGWAARTQLRLRLADFASVAFAGSMSTVGFGSLEKNISQRNLNDSRRYNVTASVELGQLFPEKSNIKLPMYFSVSESVDNPQYNPLDPDILLSSSLDSYENQSQSGFDKKYCARLHKDKEHKFYKCKKGTIIG